MPNYFKNFQTVQVGHTKDKLKLNSATASAAMRGQLNSVIFLHENGYSISRNTALTAAYNGHYEIFKYCFEKFNDDKKFWDCHYNLDKILPKMDFSDPTWLRLKNVNLDKWPQLKNIVEIL
jgi:hypothetical protein